MKKNVFLCFCKWLVVGTKTTLVFSFLDTFRRVTNSFISNGQHLHHTSYDVHCNY